jgi:hypothetical protein
MLRDLKRLLNGTAAEQDMLSLITAAGGGLTTSDLAQLNDLLRWQVDDHLNTRNGRTFAARDPYYEAEGAGLAAGARRTPGHRDGADRPVPLGLIDVVVPPPPLRLEDSAA